LSEMTRRGFIEWAVGLGTGAMAVFYLGAAFELVKPVPASKAQLQNVGPLAGFKLETPTFVTYTGGGVEDGIFVVRHAQGSPTVFDFHCAHLQCPVQWVAGANEFACPCHGSTYNVRGEHTGGPAPHGLWYHYTEVRDGNVYVGGIEGNAGNA
jgi:Rieske Fe-S protein